MVEGEVVQSKKSFMGMPVRSLCLQQQMTLDNIAIMTANRVGCLGISFHRAELQCIEL